MLINHLFIRIVRVVIVMSVFSCSIAGAVERLFWDKVPLRITLPVGKERMVTFPSDVRVGIPELMSSKLRTQSHQGTVYWKASEPFDTQRIEVREIKSNRIYLIDLKASKKARSVIPIEVMFKNRSATDDSTPGRMAVSHSKKSSAPGYIQLTRYAAQQLYAPARLLKARANIHRVSVIRRPENHLIRGENIMATPVASWQSGSLYVTAVELQNTGRNFISLDPRHLRGIWRTATFQHTRLHPAGSESDTTAVYLISDRPYDEVI